MTLIWTGLYNPFIFNSLKFDGANATGGDTNPSTDPLEPGETGMIWIKLPVNPLMFNGAYMTGLMQARCLTTNTTKKK